jgi:hypothetical protein
MCPNGSAKITRITEAKRNLAAATPPGGRVSRAIFNHTKEPAHEETQINISMNPMFSLVAVNTWNSQTEFEYLRFLSNYQSTNLY